MAEILLARFRIITDRGSGFTPGKFVESYWDDVTDEIKSYLKNNRNDPPGTPLVSGPDLGSIGWRGRSPSYDSFLEYPQNNVPIPYSFCDVLSLNSFSWKSTFPYTTKTVTENHFSCVSVVCDIQITSYSTGPDSINIEATSSNGVVRYSLDPNFQYSSGQISGVFTGLFAGTYTVTAMDELNCIAQIELVIGASVNYSVLYRLDLTSVKGIPCRLDIEQRDYDGEIIEICAGSHAPIFIKGNNEAQINRFTPILPCEIQAVILSQTNFYFQDLFNADDRKYRLKYYENRSGEVGYPSNLFESYPFSDWTNKPGTGVDWTLGSLPSVTITNGFIGKARELSTPIFAPVGIDIEIFFRVSNPDPDEVDLRFKFYKEGVQVGSGTADIPGGDTDFSGSITITPSDDCDEFTVDIVKIDGSGDSDFAFLERLYTNVQAVGYELKMAGYSISQNYREDYKQPPYPVTIVAVDCLADLKNYDFKDQSDNVYQNIEYTLLSLIVDILSKTDLRLNICMAVNKYEQDMDTGLDPFVQVTINPRIFDGKKCFDVLTEILKPFGARIVLRNGEWLIYCIEQQVTDVDFRRFDYQGELIEEGTYFDLVSVLNPDSTAWFRRDTAVLEQIFAYGVFDLIYSLIKNESLLDSYSFEDDDLIAYPNGSVAIKGWNVNITNDPGGTFGIKETNSFEGKWSFFYKIQRIVTDFDIAIGKYATLTALTKSIEYDVTDLLKISIDISAILGRSGSVLYGKFQWSLKIGSYYYNSSDGIWTTDDDYMYNSVFIKTFNEKQTIESVINFREVDDLTVEDLIFEIRLYIYPESFFSTTSNDPNDYDEVVAEVPTLKLPVGYIITGSTGGGGRSYELIEGPAEGDEIEPDDYDENDNNKAWKYIGRPGTGVIQYWYVDNVRIVHLPGGEDAPQTITTEKVNNVNFKNNFEETYLLNDIDIDNINNSERTYRNFFKLLDGSPTQVWSRTWRAGEGKLLDLLADELSSQYKRTSYKITSPFGVSIDGEVWPSTILKDEFDNDRKYMFMGYSRDVINDEVSGDIHEIVDVTDDESPDIDAGFTTGFSLGYRA